MNRTQPGGDWDDERLSEAFRARAAVTPPTPFDLVDEVHARANAAGPGPRWPRLAAVAALLALAVLVGGSAIVSQLRPSASIPPAAGSHDPASIASGRPVVDALGDPITVAAALGVRGSEHGDREIVVQGFLSPLPMMFCPMQRHPQNPTFLRCPEDKQWLMEQPEQLVTNTEGGTHFGVPVGPGFQLSFALVEAPPAPMPVDASSAPVAVVLVGHFHDRRAERCEIADRERCRATFVVDRVVSVDGVERQVGTDRLTDLTAKDLEEDVDALVGVVAPNAAVVSRQLVPIAEVMALEPVLADDQVVPYIGNQATLFWLVTTVDLVDGIPITRTYGLIDGSNWFAEITRSGARMEERPVIRPPATDGPILSPGDPSAFDAAPTSIAGIPVRDIKSIQRERASAMDQLGRDEMAIRAWYIGPDPAAICDDLPRAVHAPLPPCDDARAWLLDDPSQYRAEPGQRRANPAADHYTPVLNPLLPVDVSFDVGPTWQGSTPVPKPVIVLGHFVDNRVDTYAGNLYFVIDQLVWAPDRPNEQLGSLVRLTPDATEDVASVLARIDAVSPGDSVATWTTVVDAKDFAAIDGRANEMPEYASGAPIWVVRRLIHSEQDGRERLAIQWVWTADGGRRIWWTECPDCGVDLATSTDLRDFAPNVDLLRVFDYDDVLAAVGPATGLSGLNWQQPHGNATDGLDVARGRTAQEVAIRWVGPSCPRVTWFLEVHDSNRDGGFYFSVSTRNESCEGDDQVVRRVLLQFDHPIDLDKIEGPSCCG